MVNEYMCDYGNCMISRESSKMIYLRIPSSVDIEVKRFCSKEHLVKWILKNMGEYNK